MFFIVIFHAGMTIVKKIAEPEVKLGYIENAVADGLSQTTLAFCLGSISGAHLNPATTFVFFIRGCFKYWRVPYYWICQFIGALLGAVTLFLLFGDIEYLGAPIPERVTAVQALFIEIIATTLNLM
jgi:glycerol uptake facilitator-like aquaporin